MLRKEQCLRIPESCVWWFRAVVSMFFLRVVPGALNLSGGNASPAGVQPCPSQWSEVSSHEGLNWIEQTL